MDIKTFKVKIGSFLKLKLEILILLKQIEVSVARSFWDICVTTENLVLYSVKNRSLGEYQESAALTIDSLKIYKIQLVMFKLRLTPLFSQVFPFLKLIKNSSAVVFKTKEVKEKEKVASIEQVVQSLCHEKSI